MQQICKKNSFLRSIALLGLIFLMLLGQSCGKSEEHLRCEKAFKAYYGEHLAVAFAVAAMGAADPSALNITSLEVAEYRILGEIRPADSLTIIRRKAIEKYEGSLQLTEQEMKTWEHNYKASIEAYFRNRIKAEDFMARYNATGEGGGYDRAYYESMLERPRRTETELKEIYLKDPYSDYSRYVACKEKIEDMKARREEIIDNWFEDSSRYKFMDADKVLGKSVEITYYINGDKSTMQKTVLIFSEDLTKVLGEKK